MKYTEIESNESLNELLKNNLKIKHFAFQDVDFTKISYLTKDKIFEDCLFLGCTIPDYIHSECFKNCLIFPKIDVPYNVFINHLYQRDELFSGYELGNPSSYENTLDKTIYNHYLQTGKEADDIKESLARRLHDHSVTDALYDFLAQFDEKKIVAIMGGHSLPRGDQNYIKVAQISKKLTELDYLMVSGGGPGAMEATHLGAWFAHKSEEDLLTAINILSDAPSYKDHLWIDKAFEVLKMFPDTAKPSLGIPTWLYGHEPPTPFATHIAKYFANSVREDGLLAIAKGGVIFTPGSAGTIQEIFQEATQNHYLSYGYASPMVFFDKHYWTNKRPVYPLLKQMAEEEKYQNMLLSIYDETNQIVDEILQFTKASLQTT
jgi:predicted Rossmann-fold nucleotide-binding protein